MQLVSFKKFPVVIQINGDLNRVHGSLRSAPYLGLLGRFKGDIKFKQVFPDQINDLNILTLNDLIDRMLVIRMINVFVK
jgi:hypothetical protein